MGISFERCTDIGGKEFLSAVQIYLEAFPPNERHPVKTIEHRVENGDSLLYVAKDASDVVAMALLWPLKGMDGFVLLDFLAVKQSRRNQHIGAAFFRFLRLDLLNNGRKFVIEVEHPLFGENQDQRLNRISFYLKNGAGILRNVRYILPPLDDSSPTEMLLMVCPAEEGDIFTSGQINELVTRLYDQLYGRTANDPLLNLIYRDIPSVISTTTRFPYDHS